MPAIVTLVALRLAIGWHFYKEGVSHHTDPHWSSEGFLKQARGPLGPLYHSLVPDFHGWDRLMLAPLDESKTDEAAKPGEDGAAGETGEKGETPASEKPAADKDAADKTATDKTAADKTAGDNPVAADKTASDKSASPKAPPKKAARDAGPSPSDPWLKQVRQDWQADADAAAEFYKFDAAQKEKAAKLLDADSARMREVTDDFESDIVLYRRLVARADRLATVPGVDQIPFEKARAAAVQKNPLGETGISGQASPLSSAPPVWLAAAQDVDKLFHDQLVAVATPEQRQLGLPASANSKLHKLDTALAWTLMIVGGLLIVGLFTRLAALVGALFLLSIICAQPPWLADSLQTFTYNQTVEMLALLVLGAIGAGRWGGLDFFVSRCCTGCCSSKKGTGTAQ